MKNKFFKIVKFSLILAIIGYIGYPNISNAIFDGPTFTIVNNIIGSIGNFLLSLASYLLAISGIFLNLSLNITTHVGDFYNSIPALNEVWLVVRNMSSIFIIFALLYSSIKVIVGAGSSSATKELIAKIVIAGVMINFSLFFTKVLIDGSNLVSLQFYRAIAPKSAGSLNNLSSAFNDGGLSDVFMSSFKIPRIYENKPVLKAVDTGLSIGISTIAGMLMMIIAAISLLGASVAIMFRTAYLIFIMAVSPIYFAAMIFPQLEDKAKEVTKIFKAQLIFMPTYLFLMYVALKLISSPGFSAIFNQGSNGVPGAGEGPFGVTSIAVMVQFIIASIFINAPLVAAIAAGASGAKFAEGWTDALSAKIKGIPGAFGQNTIGRGAKAIQGSLNSSEFASRNPNIAILANKTLKNVAESSFGGSKGGYEKRYKESVKEKVEYGKKLKTSAEVKKNFIVSGLANFDKETENLNEELAKTQRFKDMAYKRVDDMSITENQRQLAFRKAKEYEDKENNLKQSISNRNRNTEAERLGKESEKINANEFAKNLSTGLFGNKFLQNPGTIKSRKEAADSIRKELYKSKDKKLLEDLKEALEDGKPTEKKEEGKSDDKK
jgi:hypothetical protein